MVISFVVAAINLFSAKFQNFLIWSVATFVLFLICQIALSAEREGDKKRALARQQKKDEENLALIERKYKENLALIEREIQKHSATLSRKKRQLVYLDDYGGEITSRWIDEKTYFMDHTLAQIIPGFLNVKNNRLYVSDMIEKIVSEGGNRQTAIEPSDGPWAARRRKSKGGNGQMASESVSFTQEMMPADYERFVADIISKDGWNARVTGCSGDQGADVIAEKLGNRIVVQCKRYAAAVGNSAVQEAHAAKGFYEARLAVVVAPAGFTQSARQLASQLQVTLCHHDEIALALQTHFKSR